MIKSKHVDTDQNSDQLPDIYLDILLKRFLLYPYNLSPITGLLRWDI